MSPFRCSRWPRGAGGVNGPGQPEYPAELNESKMQATEHIRACINRGSRVDDSINAGIELNPEICPSLIRETSIEKTKILSQKAASGVSVA